MSPKFHMSSSNMAACPRGRSRNPAAAHTSAPARTLAPTPAWVSACCGVVIMSCAPLGAGGSAGRRRRRPRLRRRRSGVRRVAFQDLGDPGGVRAEDGHELRRWHLVPLAGEERLQPQQVRGVPGREDGQRAEQADPRPGRAGLARRPVQPGQRVGARRGEHVLLAAQQAGDRGVVQVQPLDQARIGRRQLRSVLVGQDRGRVGPGEQVTLGVLDDRVEGRPLRGRGGGQVVVALDCRGVVRVDR